MDLQKIKALMDLMANSSLSELELEEGECRLRMARGTVVANPRSGESGCVEVCGDAQTSPEPKHASVVKPPLASTSPTASEACVVKAPMYGLFFLTPSPGEPQFVSVGQTVHKGQKLCMLEAMKLFHSLESECDGIVTAILAEHGQEVEAGQPLFRIE